MHIHWEVKVNSVCLLVIRETVISCCPMQICLNTFKSLVLMFQLQTQGKDAALKITCFQDYFQQTLISQFTRRFPQASLAQMKANRTTVTGFIQEKVQV